ncbi:hypothetical protein DAEQUDRAFT_734278 [Daedalea quercina L-15889]|uniref:PHD-type domain-containing protein n=1 Tax=Daedalea quercina L-15889 TaxID=1314783 RepID=A0A165UBA2_9APHY|nr:hypothetical protein DAEQUDRAFT_734278 [Daedalea quercina L-15889]
MTGPSSPSMLFSGSPPSSLLPMSESRTSSLSHESPGEIESRPAAASLPNILNSSSPALRPNTGLGGLEALVQAATEERRRLSGELGQGLSRMDSSPKPSESPVPERVPMQLPVAMNAATKPLSPFAVRTSFGGRRDILNDDVSASPLRIQDSDGEPPRKRRKSSGVPNSSPSPMVIQQPITPCDVAVPASPTEVTQVLSPTVNDKKTGTVIDDDLRTTSIPVAPHEVGGSTSDAEVLEVRPAVGPQPRDETLEEQILDAVDGSSARVGEKDRVREKEDKMREKEKKKREQKSKEKRASEQKRRTASVARETEANAGDQDAHEWLLEHYASTSPRVDPASSSSGNKAATSPTTTALPASSSRAVKAEEGHRGRHHIDESGVTRPSKDTKKARSRTPTPLAMLEEELDSVLPASYTIASSIDDELILDVASPVMAPSVGGGVTDDNDVDNELLSLVDDVPPVPHTSRPKPANIPKFDIHSRTKSSLSQPASERGSMPPPASPVKDGGTPHPPSTGDSFGGASAVAGHRKKDPSQKPVPKQKAPPKPKPKAATTTTTKTKSKVAKDAVSSAPNPTLGMLTPSTSTFSAKGKKNTAASSANPATKRPVSAAGGQSRSRSTSAMPTAPVTEGDGKPTSEIADPGEVKEQNQDDKLYCICKTRYDEDRAMIACDRCDEWYHTQCVNMPELEIDLVDQFICPLCVRNNPHLRLQTTYKKRCFNGLNHPDPSSPSACHRPARGTYSKYCSDECGILHMQARIHAWRGDKDSLWESVKNAPKREGVVVLVKDASDNGNKATGNDYMSPAPSSAQPILEVVKPSRTKVERERERLNGLLDKISCRRDELKKEMDVLLWREKLIELAVARAEQVDECGWDQRLCFGEEEYAEFGASVLESYEEVDQSVADAMQMDGTQTEEGEWWCRGQKKCARHAGWQKLRLTEVDCDKEALDGVLSKLTTQEREIRKRIEDVVNPTAGTSATDPTGPTAGSPLQRLNGKTVTNGHARSKVNGESAKKGKKKKI